MFLQSPEWEAFQRGIGRKIWRADNQLIIQHKLPFGFNYLYCPRPHINSVRNFHGVFRPPRELYQAVTHATERRDIISNGINNADSFFAQAQEIAEKNKSIFLKIDPATIIPNTKYQIPNTNSIQPQKTIILDLSKSEEELLSAMHEKTRYNIRLAVKRGVEVNKYQNLEIFWNLLQETARRDGFHTHERQYYQKLFAAKSENFSNELFFAEYQGNVLATALVNFYRGPTLIDRSATYIHGASSREYKEVMAPHLLQWEIIKEAKCRGFRYYDFWGIDEERWPGVTRFKKGFNGEFREYPQSIDIIYRPWQYFLYRVARKVASI